MHIYHFFIKGLDCSEEVGVLKSAFRDVLEEAESQLGFDLINGKLTVKLSDNSRVSEKDLVNIIKKTGMEAISWVDFCAAGVCAVEQNLWQRKGRAILCGISGLFILFGIVYHSSMQNLITALTGGSGWSEIPLPSIVFYLAAVFTGTWFILPKALRSAKILRPDMNLLMTFAIAGALILGELFEAATVSFLFAIALMLESWSLSRSRKAIKALMNLAPDTARFRRNNSVIIEEMPVWQLPEGVTVIVSPGEKVPVDGIITGGNSYIDQSPITGESNPVFKEKGDEVYAASINTDSLIEIHPTKSADDTMLSRIIRLVEEAHSKKAATEQWIEKFARIYTPIMLLTAVLIAVIPPLLGLGVFNDWFYKALVILVIGCPCALVISTPVGIVAALASAARAGILIKGGIFIEIPSVLKAIGFDKTGTLTYGVPSVQEIISINDHTPKDILRNAAALEIHSSHPLAKAIVNKADEENIKYIPAENFRIFPGKGAEGSVEGKNFWVGSHRFLHERIDDDPEFHKKAASLERSGYTVVAVGMEDHVCGLISLADEVRENVPEMIRSVKELGIEKTVILTGDNESTAKEVARKTNADSYMAELLPEDKVNRINELVKEYGYVALVGDGVNDAPALAASTVGIAMGAAGTDAAIETADIALMSDDLSLLPWLMKHSRKTMGIIKANAGFAIGLKLAFIFLASAGLATLWMAIIADMGASLAVIFNSLRLLNHRK